MKTHPGIYSHTHTDGKDVFQFELKNSKGSTIGITNWGAIINYFKIIMPGGEVNDIVHGFYNLKDYLGEKYLAQYPWFGCIVGRNANRIDHAQFELEGKSYNLTKNNGKHQLHGGAGGFDRRVWEFHSMDEGSTWIELKYISADGEEGFPGNVEVIARYEWSDENDFTFSLRAKTDQATPINLTQHSYFNLNNNKGTIHDHKIRLYCSSTLDQEDLVATGKISTVENTPYDFTQLRSIGDGLAQVDEFDKTWVRDEKGYGLAAEAHCEESNTHLFIFTTDPVVHFYSGKWTPEVEGKDGIIYGPFSGFCMETHKHPNAVNLAHFPDTILRPGEEYYQKTVWRVQVGA